MKKDELIALLSEKLGIEVTEKQPKVHKKPAARRSKVELKAKLLEVKALRDKARTGKDHKQIDLLRRRIHLLKRQISRIA